MRGMDLGLNKVKEFLDKSSDTSNWSPLLVDPRGYREPAMELFS